MAWACYQLIDPRDRSPFYIGVSVTPLARRARHASDITSSAMSRSKEIKAAGFEVGLKVIEWFDTELAALLEEACQIAETPGLVNIQRFTVLDIMRWQPHSVPR